MKIAIASMGRFHVLDLARELDALGEYVRFYRVALYRIENLSYADGWPAISLDSPSHE